ncbi:MAG TPA: FxLYD domain-containing protein [Dehalococcoidia bacterium]
MNRNVIVALLIFSLVIASVACAGGTGLNILSQHMTVHEFSGSAPDSSAVVYGQAQNVKDTAINSAVISVNFYDKNKKLVASGTATKQNLQPDATWDFSVQTVGPDAWKIVSYDISVSIR